MCCFQPSASKSSGAVMLLVDKFMAQCHSVRRNGADSIQKHRDCSIYERSSGVALKLCICVLSARVCKLAGGNCLNRRGSKTENLSPIL